MHNADFICANRKLLTHLACIVCERRWIAFEQWSRIELVVDIATVSELLWEQFAVALLFPLAEPPTQASVNECSVSFGDRLVGDACLVAKDRLKTKYHCNVNSLELTLFDELCIRRRDWQSVQGHSFPKQTNLATVLNALMLGFKVG